MDKWLQGFAFRIQISMWAFIAAFLIAWFIALFTVSYHALKVANTNPAEALKYE
jgi:putative ABC transport system permease protein